MRNGPMRHRPRAAIMLVALVASGCAGHVSPPGPVMPDRPGFTDTPPAMPAGAFQLEAGFTDDRVGGVDYLAIGETLLRIGVGGGSEARVFGNSLASRSSKGIPTESGMEDSKI